MAITVGGLISGINTQEVIEQLLELERKPITKLQLKEAAYQVQLTSYGVFRSELSSLRTAAGALDSSLDFNVFKGTSSKESSFTASVFSTADTGVTSIEVNSLASAHKLRSEAFGTNSPVGAGTFTLQLGASGTVTEITTSATDTLSDVARMINEAQRDIRASVITDGDKSYLTLASQKMGADNDIRLTVTSEGQTGASNVAIGSAMTSLAGSGVAARGALTLGGTGTANRLEINGVDLGTMSIGGNGANTLADVGADAVTTNTDTGQTYAIKINGYNLDFTGTGTKQSVDVVNAINADTTLGAAGITARILDSGTDQQIEITAADGRTITLATGEDADNNLTAADLGFDTVTSASKYENTLAGGAIDEAKFVDNSTWRFTLNGHTVDFALGGASEAADVVTAIKNAINSDSTLQGAGISASGTDTLNITADDGRALSITGLTQLSGETTGAVLADLGFSVAEGKNYKAATFNAEALAGEMVAAINGNPALQGQNVWAVMNSAKNGIVVVADDGDAIDFSASNFSAAQLGLAELTFESTGGVGALVKTGGPVQTTAGSGLDAVGTTTIDLNVNGVLLSGIVTGTTNSAESTITNETLTGAGTFTINGETVNVTDLTNGDAASAANAAAAIRDAINGNTTLTDAGITASGEGAELIITAADGREITIGAGSLSLADLGGIDAATASTFSAETMAQNIVAAIQGSNDVAAQGITATVNNDGTGVIFMNFTGEAIDLSGEGTTATAGQLGVADLKMDPPALPAQYLTDDIGLSRLITSNLTQTQAASDAELEVDGVTVTRSSNTVSDLIKGVTLTLHGTTDKAETLTVSQDTGAIAAKVQTFVDAYNSVSEFLKESQAYDAKTKEAGALQGDNTTNLIRRQLNNLVAGTVSAGVEGLSRLTDLGITLDKEGQLQIDSDKLSDAIQNRFLDVQAFFSANTESEKGFAVSLTTMLDRTLSTTEGPLATRTKGIETSIGRINKDITRYEARIERSQARLLSQFQSMELILAQYQQLGDYLTQQIASLQTLNQSIANK